MERPEDRKVLYKFFSHKNNRNMYVHNRGAMEYAADLEEAPWVKSYETNVILAPDRLSRIVQCATEQIQNSMGSHTGTASTRYLYSLCALSTRSRS